MNNSEKFEIYIISLWLLFLLIIVVTLEIPICFGDDCAFIGFKEIIKMNAISIIAFIFLLSGVFFYFKFEKKIAGTKSLPTRIDEVEDLNYEHLTFLTTYIIPMICFNLASYRYAAALLVLLIVIGIIYVRTDKFYANPTLAVIGFSLYTVKIKDRAGNDKKVVLLSKGKVAVGKYIQYLELDSKIFYAREAK